MQRPETDGNRDIVAAFIEIRGLEHVYRLERGEEIRALRGIHLTIEQGEFVALIGANGSGKSTLARHLNALLLPTSGHVWVDGMSTTEKEHLWEIRRRVGMVFQNPENQLVASTVEEDVAFGPENLGLRPDLIRKRIDDALRTVGLETYRTTPPQMLSGGQKQLVAIAGILATQPACIVFDEPTSMLDPYGREQVLGTIERLNTAEGMTIVMITQSMDEAAVAERVLAMHDGEILIDGAPEEVFEQRGRLESFGLGVPAATEIAHHVRERGLPMGPGMVTVDQVASALIDQVGR